MAGYQQRQGFDRAVDLASETARGSWTPSTDWWARSGPRGVRQVRQEDQTLEERVRSAEAMDLFNAITWSMEEGVYTVDGGGCLTYVNPAAERALGWKRDDLLGRDVHNLVHGHNEGPCRIPDCPFDAALRSGRKSSGETRLTRRDGSSFPASFNVAPLGRAPGHPEGAVVIFTDLSGRKQSEEHLRRTREHSERLEALEQAKSKFLNLASHELRGPLAVLRGYISMIEDGTLGELSPDLSKVVPILSSKLRQMDLLVNDMLETARLEDTRMQLDFEKVDLREIVPKAVDLLVPIDSPHEIKLELPREPVRVNADLARVLNIVNNLIDNAIKYSPDGGEIRCIVRRRGQHATLTVTDQGIGIAPDDVARLFTRFGRIVTRDNSHIPGTGLGLYLSRELARLHGGDITVVSSPGAGSTFTLSLPAAG